MYLLMFFRNLCKKDLLGKRKVLNTRKLFKPNNLIFMYFLIVIKSISNIFT